MAVLLATLSGDGNRLTRAELPPADGGTSSLPGPMSSGVRDEEGRDRQPKVQKAQLDTRVALVVHAAAEDRSPIEAVELVSIVEGGPPVGLGLTDGEGQLRMECPDGSFVLVARKEGWRTRERVVQEPVPSVIDVVLLRGDALVGTVTGGETGESFRGGVRVVAWPSEWRLLPDAAARLAHSNDPRILGAITDDTGRFRIEGVSPEEAYDLLAVAPGGVSWPPQPARAGVETVLRLKYLYGVRVRMQESGGGTLRLDSALRFYSRGLPFELEQTSAEYVMAPNPLAELLGEDEAPSYGDPTCHEFLFVSRAELAEPPSLVFTADYPGYFQESFRLEALLADNGIHTRTLELDPTRDERRSLFFSLHGVPEPAQGTLRRRGGIGGFKFSSALGQRSSVDLNTLGGAECKVKDLPRSWSFKHLSLFDVPYHPPASVEILANKDERWAVDCSGLTFVEFELVQPDGSLYTGPMLGLPMVYRERKAQGGGPAWFEGPPFLFITRGLNLDVTGILPRFDSSGSIAGASLEPRYVVRRVQIDWP